MPKIDGGSSDVKVMLRLDDTAPWMLVRSEESTPERLVLDMMPGGSFHAGSTAYSGDDPVVRDTKVSIRCDGVEVHEIARVMVTY